MLHSKYFRSFSPLFVILIFICGSKVNAGDNPLVEIRAAADRGDADSQAQLADIYRYGKGVKSDSRESFQWARKAADQGHAQAQHYLGICYTYEIGVKRDLVEAFKWFQKSAEQGYIAGEYRLGMCYLEGNGVPRDNLVGVRWLEKAANRRDSDAQFRLGCYYDKQSVLEKKDEEENPSLPRSGRRSGMPPLSELFRDDVSLSGTSRVEAYMWYNLASASGHSDAGANLKKLSARMTTSEISAAQHRSSEWKPLP